MPNRLIWAGAAGAGLFFYRRLRCCFVDKRSAKANFGKEIKSPDETGAAVTILPNARGIDLYIRCWGAETVSSPRGIVFLFHGGGWHSGYYAPVAKELVSHGFLVYSYDYQSHGLSGSVRGLQADIQSFSEVARDSQSVVEVARVRRIPPRHFLCMENQWGF